MSMECATKWTEWFLKAGNIKDRKITFYGGEPLLNINPIIQSCHIADIWSKETGINRPKFHMFTNGTLISKYIHVIKKYQIYPILSIDGDRGITSKNRKRKDGKSLWRPLQDSVQVLRDEGVEYGVACTLEDLSFNTEYVVNFLVSKIQPKTIEFSIRHDAPFAMSVLSTMNHDFSSFGTAWDICCENNIYVIDLMKRAKALISGIPLWNSSSGCKNKIAITPDGRISPFNGGFIYPDLCFDGLTEKSEEFFDRIWRREVRNEEKCKNCDAIFICGQGSAFASYMQSGSFSQVPACHCEYSKYIMEYFKNKVQQHISGENHFCNQFFTVEQISGDSSAYKISERIFK